MQICHGCDLAFEGRVESFGGSNIQMSAEQVQARVWRGLYGTVPSTVHTAPIRKSDHSTVHNLQKAGNPLLVPSLGTAGRRWGSGYPTQQIRGKRHRQMPETLRVLGRGRSCLVSYGGEVDGEEGARSPRPATTAVVAVERHSTPTIKHLRNLPLPSHSSTLNRPLSPIHSHPSTLTRPVPPTSSTPPPRRGSGSSSSGDTTPPRRLQTGTRPRSASGCRRAQHPACVSPPDLSGSS